MVRGFQSYFSHTLYSAALHLRKGNGPIEKGKQMSASLDPGTSSQSPSSPHIQSRRGVAIVLLAVVIWSTTPVFIDHLQTVDRLSPLQVSTWRALLVTALQWLGLGLIVVSVTVMQLSALLHSRKTPL